MSLRETLLDLSRNLFSYVNQIRVDPNSSKIVGYHSGDTSRIADREIETFIIDYFNKKTDLKIKFVTEESGVIDRSNSDYIAVIDPLDGSSNFVMGIPWYSVSIALYERGSESMRKSVAGIIMNLTTGKVYSYDKRRAYMDGSPALDTPRVVLAYYDIDQVDQAKEIMEKVEKPFKVRTLGSASLDMSLVCEGRASLYFDIRSKLRNVDIAASTNFCIKMGFSIINQEGKPLDSSIENVERIKDWVITSKSLES
ncbi:inositol monophosphatase family protein [Sulfuracidifex metallicus]|uniref:inositol monophosphatase family protein n=1 Tax=Sulfuracidifex metallicus TaxID=47303 RepID=UPI00227643A2|nr:inositol monophosphatase family protein [Sulfuracidifex metallicus]MCY0850424.1 hypothetical protein [Sulfuracidifex metallicus]